MLREAGRDLSGNVYLTKAIYWMIAFPIRSKDKNGIISTHKGHTNMSPKMKPSVLNQLYISHVSYAIEMFNVPPESNRPVTRKINTS